MAMSFNARLLSKAGKLRHQHWKRLQPLQISWTALGGCEQASLRLEGSHLGLEAWQSYLGNPVEIVDAFGRLRWWGWLEAVRQDMPGARLCYDLARMANRVAVGYYSIQTGDSFGEWQQTNWADDPESQALFGVKEKIINGGFLTREQAEHWRDLELHRWRLPKLQAEPAHKEANQGISLICKGWMHRLNWRVWQRESGIISNSVSQNGVQVLGADSQTGVLAQSFKARREVKLSSIQLRVRKNGLPLDQLRVDIRADQAGSPSQVNLASCVLNAAEISADAYAWVGASLAAQISLSAGMTYWFVLSRTGGSNSTHYYLLGVDEGLHYVDGQLKLYKPSDQTWVPRLPAADALFRLTVLSRVENELRAMLTLADDILSGFDLEASIGLLLPANPATGKPLLDALRDTLALGTSDRATLLMEILPERFLRVYKAAEAGKASFLMNQNGTILDRMGQEVELISDVVGKRVGIEQGGDFLVGEARLNPEMACVSLKTL